MAMELTDLSFPDTAYTISTAGSKGFLHMLPGELELTRLLVPDVTQSMSTTSCTPSSPTLVSSPKYADLCGYR